MADFLNSKNKRYALGGIYARTELSIGAYQVSRATPPSNFTGLTSTTPCIWEVVDWPFSADENGIAFDQPNLYGIRNYCSRRALVDGGGDKYQGLYPVPKILPAGYIASDRKRFNYDPHYSLMRTAGGFGAHKSWSNNWYDFSAVDQVAPSLLSISAGSMTYVPAGGFMGNYAFSLGDQVGFRGAIISIIGAISQSGGPYGGSVTCRIGIDADPSNPWLYYSTGANPPTIVGSFSGAIGDHPTGIDTTQSFGALIPITLGVRSAFYLIVDGDTSAGWTVQAQFASRTDIPPFCTVTYKNKVAPGGIVP